MGEHKNWFARNKGFVFGFAVAVTILNIVIFVLMPQQTPIRIDETDGLLPGMNVDAEIVLEEAADTLAIPSSAVTRGSGNTSLVLITQDSPSAESAVEQESPEGYVYVQVETGISDNSYVQILSGLQEGDTVAYVTRSTESGSMMMGGMPGAMGGDMPAGMPSGMGSAPGGGMPSGGGPGGGFPG